jgi:ferredoxin
MEELKSKVRELLKGGTVQAVIGYTAGSDPSMVRPAFVRSPEQADTLVLDAHCTDNLAVYLLKPEVKALGKLAVVATVPALRTILQLASENQLVDGQVLVLGVAGDGQVAEMATFAAIEEFVGKIPAGLDDKQKALLARIEAMSRQERWAFWQGEFARCIKCYACRQACPMCYCTKCIVETNQPQWIPVSPHEEGNLEWHIVRAMHLAGRCLNCGFCAKACPVGIPLNLLTQRLAQEALSAFGAVAGTSAKGEYALSMFKADDKEGFIR